MKLNKVICALASLMLITGSLVTMTAADIPTGKGAAKLLMKPVVTPAATVMASMPCAKCTDKYTSTRDLSARGANKPIALVARHECDGCSTMISAVGVGKAKHNVALHTCTIGAVRNLNCCSTN